MPVVILTTSAVVDDVTGYARAERGQPAPRVVEIDALNLDSPGEIDVTGHALPRAAYLQYTSGSTRLPAGVVVSHRNIIANLGQVMSDYFEDRGKVPPPDATVVSWLPFYHDMGLIFGICAPIVAGVSSVVLSPIAFLQRPARWIQLLAQNGHSFSAAPNFAFELAVRRTSDEDMAGFDLGDVLGIISGSERIHATTLKRFNDRFARFNLSETVVRPSYGLAEATVYVATPEPGRPPKTVRFEYEKLSAGHAKRCANHASGAPSWSVTAHRGRRRCESSTPTPGWRIPPERSVKSGCMGTTSRWATGGIPNKPSARSAQGWSTPRPARRKDRGCGPETWASCRTTSLFIMGRIKDLLIVDGRNHYPDDIEATIQEITGGRVAAISIPDDRTEKLVAIVELKKRGDSHEEALQRLRTVKREVTSAISQSHSVRVADLVLVPPGSIPITTSGKVRRSACVDRYRQDEFTRLDVPV